MLPEPPIGANLIPRGTFSALRGFVFALLIGSAATGTVLLIPIGLQGWQFYIADTSADGWRARPFLHWDGAIRWPTVAFLVGWTAALSSFVHFAPAQRTGLIRSLRIAVVATLLAVLANSLIFPKGIKPADDSEIRVRIAAFVGISSTIALTTRQSPIW